MRWAFWRRDSALPHARAGARPLPSEVGLRWPDDPQGGRSGGRIPRSAGNEEQDDRWGADALRGSAPTARAATDAGDPLWPASSEGGGPGDGAAGPAVEDLLDREVLALVRDTTVDAVTALLEGDPVAVRSALTPLAGRLATATLEQQSLAVVASLAVLPERLPPLAGATGTGDDPEQRALLLAYADLLVARAEPLRRRAAPQAEPDALRYAGHFACGAPDAEPSLAGRAEAPAADQVLAACVLLAQTCLDGAAGPASLAAELDAVLPAE